MPPRIPKPPFPVRERVPFAELTTLGLGGPARYLAAVRSVPEARAALSWAADARLPVLVLGGGSNLLVADRGFPGLVLGVELAGVGEVRQGESVLLRAAAGEDWDGLVARAVGRGWAGIECLSGIPGRVGATPIQNVGAYGQEVAEVLVEVEALDRTSGREVALAPAECGFGYRTSRFRGADRDRFLITSVTFRLVRGGAPTLRYPDLLHELARRGLGRPSLGEVRRAVLAIRRRKGMVLDARDPDTRSAGSFFLNPVLAPAELERLRERVRGDGDSVARGGMPSFPMADGRVKVPAAWLVERAGFRRGLARGGVGISTRHALAIVNRGGGTAREALELMREIQREVRRRFDVGLVPEPTLVGFEA